MKSIQVLLSPMYQRATHSTLIIYWDTLTTREQRPQHGQEAAQFSEERARCFDGFAAPQRRIFFLDRLIIYIYIYIYTYIDYMFTQYIYIYLIYSIYWIYLYICNMYIYIYIRNILYICIYMYIQSIYSIYRAYIAYI